MRIIECPKCKSVNFNYVQYEDGRYMIICSCGWELVELSPPQDDMDVEEDAEEEEENLVW